MRLYDITNISIDLFFQIMYYQDQVVLSELYMLYVCIGLNTLKL